MDAKELISELGSRFGITLELSDAGTCRVIFDEDAVDFELAGRRLFVMADLGPVAGGEALLRELLEADYLGAKTFGATISIDSEHDVFSLHAILPAQDDYEAFEENLTGFVKALREWKEIISSAPLAGEATQTLDAVAGDIPV